MASLAYSLGWQCVHIVYSAENYGEYGFKELKLSLKKLGICTASEQKAPVHPNDPLSEGDFDAIVHNIEQVPSAAAIICFCEQGTLRGLLTSLQRSRDIAMNLGEFRPRFVVVSGDSWGTSSEVPDGLVDAALGAITVKPAFPLVHDFEDWFSKETPYQPDADPWFLEFWEDRFQCTFQTDGVIDKPLCGFDPSVKLRKSDIPTSDQLGALTTALYAAAYGLQDFLSKACSIVGEERCTPDRLMHLTQRGPKVSESVLNVSFPFPKNMDARGQWFHFNEQGDGPARYEYHVYRRLEHFRSSPFGYIKIGEWSSQSPAASLYRNAKSMITWPETNALVTSVCPCVPEPVDEVFGCHQQKVYQQQQQQQQQRIPSNRMKNWSREGPYVMTNIGGDESPIYETIPPVTEPVTEPPTTQPPTTMAPPTTTTTMAPTTSTTTTEEITTTTSTSTTSTTASTTITTEEPTTITPVKEWPTPAPPGPEEIEYQHRYQANSNNFKKAGESFINRPTSISELEYASFYKNIPQPSWLPAGYLAVGLHCKGGTLREDPTVSYSRFEDCVNECNKRGRCYGITVDAVGKTPCFPKTSDCKFVTQSDPYWTFFLKMSNKSIENFDVNNFIDEVPLMETTAMEMPTTTHEPVTEEYMTTGPSVQAVNSPVHAAPHLSSSFSAIFKQQLLTQIIRVPGYTDTHRHCQGSALNPDPLLDLVTCQELCDSAGDECSGITVSLRDYKTCFAKSQACILSHDRSEQWTFLRKDSSSVMIKMETPGPIVASTKPFGLVERETTMIPKLSFKFHSVASYDTEDHGRHFNDMAAGVADDFSSILMSSRKEKEPQHMFPPSLSAMLPRGKPSKYGTTMEPTTVEVKTTAEPSEWAKSDFVDIHQHCKGGSLESALVYFNVDRCKTACRQENKCIGVSISLGGSGFCFLKTSQCKMVGPSEDWTFMQKRYGEFENTWQFSKVSS